MDAILLGGDSDDDSAKGGQTSAPSAAPVPPPQTVTTQAPPPAAAPPAASAAPTAPPTGGGNDLKERLKSLYSPAQQQHRARQAAAAAAAANPSGPAPAAPTQQVMRTSSQPPPSQHQTPPQQQHQLQRPTIPQQPPPPQQPPQRGPPPPQLRQASYPPPLPKPGGPPPRGVSNDPFAPTPVSQMRAPPPQHRTSVSSTGASSSSYQPSSSASNPAPPLGRSGAPYRGGGVVVPPSAAATGPGSRTSVTTGSTSTSSTMPTSNRTSGVPHNAQAAAAARDRDLKKQKETFLLFTRVLIKYLEQKDPHVHQQVKGIIKDCAERNKRGEAGYESVTASMRSRLKRVVSEAYWARAEAYLRQLLSQKRSGSSSNPTGGGSGPSGAGGAATARSTASSVSTNSSKGGPPTAQHMRPPPTQPPQVSTSSASSSSRRQHASAQRTQSAISDIRARQAALNKHKTQTIQAQQPQQQPPSTKTSRSTTAPPPAAAAAPPPTTTPTAQAGAPSSAASTTSATSKKSSSSKRSSSAAKSSAGTSPTGAAQRKSSMGASSVATAATAATGAAAAAAAAPEPVEKIPPAIIKEYSEYHELLDHAMNMKDWQATPLVLGQKTHAMATEEQKQLMYQPPQFATAAASGTDVFSFPRPGWGKENVVSVRNAWSKVRLREKKLYGSTGSTLTVPTPSGEQKAMHATSWFNEDVNEEDAALAALSEGAQIYIKSILEKAIYCARQRQNIDGIRLWHNQVMSAHESSTKDTANENDGAKEEEPPSLILRLGCDVQRQIARGEANAALINKRMEEALERQTDLPARKRILDEDILEEANSMSEIALRPRLARGVDEAEIEAARANEIVGGKFASEPPLGRVPKKAKLEVVDFQNGMHLAMRPGLHKASVVSGAFSF